MYIPPTSQWNNRIQPDVPRGTQSYIAPFEKKEPRTEQEAVHDRLTRIWSAKKGSIGNDILNGIVVAFFSRSNRSLSLVMGAVTAMGSTIGGVINAKTDFQADEKEKQNPSQSREDYIKRVLMRPSTSLKSIGGALFWMLWDGVERYIPGKKVRFEPPTVISKVMFALALAYIPFSYAFYAHRAGKDFDQKQLKPFPGIQPMSLTA